MNIHVHKTRQRSDVRVIIATFSSIVESHLSQCRDVEANVATFQSVEVSNVATFPRAAQSGFCQRRDVTESRSFQFFLNVTTLGRRDVVTLRTNVTSLQRGLAHLFFSFSNKICNLKCTSLMKFHSLSNPRIGFSSYLSVAISISKPKNTRNKLCD